MALTKANKGRIISPGGWHFSVFVGAIMNEFLRALVVAEVASNRGGMNAAIQTTVMVAWLSLAAGLLRDAFDPTHDTTPRDAEEMLLESFQRLRNALPGGG